MHGYDSLLVSSLWSLLLVVITIISGDFDPELQEAESLATIARGLELGINFLDTAWIYQVGLSYLFLLIVTTVSRTFAMERYTPTKTWSARPSRSMVERSLWSLLSVVFRFRMDCFLCRERKTSSEDNCQSLWQGLVPITSTSTTSTASTERCLLKRPWQHSSR